MIDLDILAESRAKSLGQDHAAWRKAVWTTDFHALSQTLTDGEIEIFFEGCRTVKHFEVMTQYLAKTGAESGITFSQVMEKVARSGYQLDEWVDSIVEVKNWAEAQQRQLPFLEVLTTINDCASRAAPSASPLVAAVQKNLKSGTNDRKQ